MSAAEATARMAEMARGDMSTKVVERATEAGGVVPTKEYNKKDAVKEILKLHKAYQQPDHQEIHLIMRPLSEVEPDLGPPRAPKS